MSKQTELSHTGLHPVRLEIYSERIFNELWQEVNTRQTCINYGLTALELILNTLPRSDFSPQRVSPVTQRDADVAATVIQWLGTNLGKHFLNEAEKRIKEEDEKQHREFNEKWNKVR